MAAESRLIDGKNGTEMDLIAFYRDPERYKVLTLYGGRVPALTDIAVEVEPCRAFVNHGRWVTACVQPRCVGSAFVWIGGPWQFMCLVCANRGIGMRWRPVIVPPNWTEIEAVLLERHIITERGWVPGETVEALLAENLQLGYSVPRGTEERAEVALAALVAAQEELQSHKQERPHVHDEDSPKNDRRVAGRRRAGEVSQ